MDKEKSISNGHRPNVHISDELEDLARLHTPEQIKRMWEGAQVVWEGKDRLILGTPGVRYIAGIDPITSENNSTSSFGY